MKVTIYKVYNRPTHSYLSVLKVTADTPSEDPYVFVVRDNALVPSSSASPVGSSASPFSSHSSAGILTGIRNWDFGDSNPMEWWDPADPLTLTVPNPDNKVFSWSSKGFNATVANQAQVASQPTTNVTPLNGLQTLQLGNASWFTLSQNIKPAMTMFFINTITASTPNWQATVFGGDNTGGGRDGVTLFTTGAPVAGNVTASGTISGVNHSGRLNAGAPVSPIADIINFGVPVTLPHPQRMYSFEYIDPMTVGYDKFFELLGGNYMTASVCDILMWNGILSNEDRQKAEGRMAHKWAVTTLLPVGHPFKLVAPLFGVVYQLDLSGNIVVDGGGFPVIL